MNKTLFFKAINNDISKVAQALELDVQDVLACVNDEGFMLSDWRKIQNACALTDSDVLEIQLTEDSKTINEALLESIITLQADTFSSLASDMRLSLLELTDKITEQKQEAFTIAEIDFIVNRYQLSKDVAMVLFFPGWV